MMVMMKEKMLVRLEKDKQKEDHEIRGQSDERDSGGKKISSEREENTFSHINMQSSLFFNYNHHMPIFSCVRHFIC